MAIDIESLYNTIPHIRDIKVIEYHLQERGQSAQSYNEFVIEFLKFILTRNVFMLGPSHFPQVQGVAMGTRCAPSYANLYGGGGESICS